MAAIGIRYEASLIAAMGRSYKGYCGPERK